MIDNKFSMLLGKYINKYYLKYGLFFIIGIIFLIGVDWLGLYIPDYLGEIVHIFENGALTPELKNEVVIIVFKMLGVAAGIALGRVVWRYTILYAAHKIEADLRSEMFAKAERLSVTYYHDNKVGTIMSWFTNDIETINEFFAWGTVMLIDAIFLTGFAIFKMVMLNWSLAIIAAIPLILIVVWGALVEKFMNEKWENRQKAFDNLYDFAQENFTGIRVIKAFVKENMEIHAFAKVARKNVDVNINFMRVSVVFDVIIEVMLFVMSGAILGFGGWFVYAAITGEPIVIFNNPIILDASTLIKFFGYFDALIWPLIAMGQVVTMHARAKTSLGRVTNYLDAYEDIKNPENAIVLKDVKGKIEYRHFSFKYPNSELGALYDINLIINPGETIGIVGKIGSGKTTIINSLLRLYNIFDNSIFIDDVDIMKADIDSVRNAIGYVPQDNFLFSDTISANISLANKDLSQDKVRKAAEFAAVDDNIMGFEKGYDTVSGERGVTLSGGQKQRISISRAYAKDAPIMILDDSVSAVDLSTEETILEHIKNDRKGKTTILVASRVSTVSKLDKIVVINEGKIEAFGTHKELLKISPTYQKMVYLQKLEKEVEKA